MIKFILDNIFSVKNRGNKKIIRILGFKITFNSKLNSLVKNLELVEENLNVTQNKILNLENEFIYHKKNYENLSLEYTTLKNNLTYIYSYFLDNLIRNKVQEVSTSYSDFINQLFDRKNVLCSTWNKNASEVLDAYKILFRGEFSFVKDSKRFIPDINIFWGTQFNLEDNVTLLNNLILNNEDYTIAEMGFLHRVAFPSKNIKFSQGCSFMFDDLAPYYDARFSNRLENLIENKDIIITESQKNRARVCIDKIVETHLTKYNHQPIFTPNIGRKGTKKVLVVDQSYGDMSITKGLANDETFSCMLECAINENPDADIIVKTHPDTIQGAGGYYKGLKQHNNIYPMTEPINPISLIKYCDKVYVCTTQLGFEALMCGKEVHVFGIPFYAGWGLTHDRQKCERRTNKRTLEEIFYIAYIMYSYYVNPEKKCRCEIEEAMDYLLKLREEYFKEINE